MQGFFLKNLNTMGLGGVAASPDQHVYDCCSYFYAWQRDGALAMRTLLETTPTSQSAPLLTNWVKWVVRTLYQSDPNGIDIRLEPKFNLSTARPFTGGWCRPQTDGPAIRATTLMLFAATPAGKALVTEYLWTGDDSRYQGGAIAFDLDWVAGGWRSSGCDLWENLRGDDFFWNRMAFARALRMGAEFAGARGDGARQTRYGAAADAVEASLLSGGHWNGRFLMESPSHRPLGSSVVPALNDCQNSSAPLFAPGSAKVAATLWALSDAFCAQLPFNNKDTAAGVPGVVLGRYPGDTYGRGGGGGWLLLSAAMAEQVYRVAYAAVTDPASVETQAEATLRALFNGGGSSSGGGDDDVPLPLGSLLLAAGDGIMQRLRVHVQPQDFHAYEQLNKDSGQQQSAYDLTWSYAAILKAMHFRDSTLLPAMEQQPEWR